MYTGLISESGESDLRHIEFESEEVTGNLFGAFKSEELQNTTFQLNKNSLLLPLKTVCW